MAVKVMLASAGDHAGELESFRQEVQVLSGLAHERIICLLGACLAPPHICIVEELANAGSLFNHLHGARPGHSPHHGMPYAQVRLALPLNIHVFNHAKSLHVAPCMASCHATRHIMVRPVHMPNLGITSDLKGMATGTFTSATVHVISMSAPCSRLQPYLLYGLSP